MVTKFPDRLREERKRLKLNQSMFAEVAGVHRKTHALYEGGKRLPDVEYLYMASQAGVDVQYLVTGKRSESAMLPTEQLVMSLWRAASAAVQGAALAVLESGSKPQSTDDRFKNATIGTHVAGGEFTSTDGPMFHVEMNKNKK